MLCRERDNRLRVHELAELAISSLQAELVLYPKPGLVSFHDCGAHDDMDATTFTRSLLGLREYFSSVALASMRHGSFAELRDLGLAAESRMLFATSGVNTHRGAIFTLGLLVAAAGAASSEGLSPSDAVLRRTLRSRFGDDLMRHMLLRTAAEGARLSTSGARVVSHGRQVHARYGASGAPGEALAAFPGVFEIGLPALREALLRGADAEQAELHAFFALLSRVEDSNVLYRAGASGLLRVQHGASSFLGSGSVFRPGWRERARALHDDFSRARLSPGGSADLFAASWFVHHLQSRSR